MILVKRLSFIFLMIPTLASAGSPAGTTQSPSMMSNIFLLVGFVLIFYFMLIRPQSKRAKEQQALLSNIAKDDEIIINGSILAKVKQVKDQYLVVAIAEGIEIKVQKQAVSASVPKGTIENI